MKTQFRSFLFVLLVFAITTMGARVAGAGTKGEQMQDHIQPKYLDLLTKIVAINSKAENLDGQDKVREALIPEFEELGFRSTLFPLPEGHKLLSLEFPASQPELLLVGHSDTVFVRGQDDDFQKLIVEADSLRGPGVIDMKGGLVLLLNALAEIKDHQVLKRIRVVINDDEEIGSKFSRAKLDELARGMNAALVFEPGLEDGALVTEESGIYFLRLKVKGKEAHAGMEPEKGINACVELAHKLIAIQELSNFEQHLTVSVGTISGGSATNKVCGHAAADIDIRYTNPADLDQTLQRIKSIAQHSWVKNVRTGEPTSAGVEELANMPPLRKESSSVLFESARAAGIAIGQRVTGRWVGYGSDGNHLATTGIQVLVGLGPYGGGMHTHEERMMKHSYSERLKLATALIRKVLDRDSRWRPSHKCACSAVGGRAGLQARVPGPNEMALALVAMPGAFMRFLVLGDIDRPTRGVPAEV